MADGQSLLFCVLQWAWLAMVSLQLVGGMITKTLLTNFQESNRGDITITILSNTDQGVKDGIIQKGNWFSVDYFSSGGLETIQRDLEQRYKDQVEITTRQTSGGLTGVSSPAKGTVNPLTLEYIIDAQHYPLYGTVNTKDGKKLGAVLSKPSDIVINQALAATLGVAVGDSVRINRSEKDFTVQGIVSDTAEPGIQNTANALFGFYYLDASALPLLGIEGSRAHIIYVKLADPTKVDEVAKTLQIAYPYLGITSTTDLQNANASTALTLMLLVNVVAVLSLLLGGIGIANTMQVIVNRRRTEIAVLKSIGMLGGQITNLFLVEAVLMGLLGSLIGCVLGLGLAWLIRGAAEAFISQTIPFQISIVPLIAGILAGVLISTIFALYPTMLARRIRPKALFQPDEALIPRSGIGLRLGIMVLTIILSSMVALLFFGITAAAVVPAAFIFAVILYMLLWAILEFLTRLVPSLGNFDLHFAMRSVRGAKRRYVSGLMALVLGIFALSLVTLLITGIIDAFQRSTVNETGGNVAVFALPVSFDAVKAAITKTVGENNFTLLSTINVELVKATTQKGETLSLDALKQRATAAG